MEQRVRFQEGTDVIPIDDSTDDDDDMDPAVKKYMQDIKERAEYIEDFSEESEDLIQEDSEDLDDWE